MKYSLALILLAASLTACNSGGICNPDTASKAHAKTPPTSGNPLVESGTAQNNNPTTPMLSTPAANESNNTPNLNPIIVTKPSESAISYNIISESNATQKYNPPTVSSYKYPDGCVPFAVIKTANQPMHYMYAQCKKVQGGTPEVYSSLNLDACTPDSTIVNNNGQLECAQYRKDTLPTLNSYRYPDGCIPVADVPPKPGYMYAICKDNQGRIPSDGYQSLLLDSCTLNSAIVNNDGQLECAQYPTVNSYRYPDDCVPDKDTPPQPSGKIHYMYAKCKNSQSVTPDQSSSLNLDACTPDSAIVNNHGRLTCAKYREWFTSDNLQCHFINNKVIVYTCSSEMQM